MKNTRTAFVVLAAALFAVSTLQAQKTSPLRVLTGKPVPTVIKTAELVTITYTLEWLDLPAMDLDKKIEIYKDDLGLDNVSFGDFEAVKLDVGPERRNGKQLSRTFTYTLRLINHDKGMYKIPPINFPWSIKEAGRSEDEEEIQHFATEEIAIGYVSTIIPETDLDIRDEIVLPDYTFRAAILLALSIITVLVVAGLIIYDTVRVRSGVTKKAMSTFEFAKLRRWKTRRDFYRFLKKGEKALGDSHAILIATELYKALSRFVLGEVPSLNETHTPQQMHDCVSEYLKRETVIGLYVHKRILNRIRQRKEERLHALISRLQIYEREINGEGKQRLFDDRSLKDELVFLKRQADGLVWYARLRSWKRS